MKKIFSFTTLFAAALFFAAAAFSQARQNAQSLFLQGVESQADRNWWDASEKFQAALRINPAYADAWFRLSQCVFEMQSYDLALSYVRNAKKYSSDRNDVLNLEGRILVSLGKFSEAETLFLQIQKKYPNDIESRFGLAELNLAKGRTTVAQNYYNDALAKNPQNVKALLALALISREAGAAREAEQYVNRAMRVGSANPQVYYVAAYLDFKNGNLKQAEKRCLSSMQLDSNFQPSYELLSLVYYAQGRYEEVIDLADYGISRDRSNAAVWYIKGLSQQKLGRQAAAISTWVLGLEAVPEDEIMRAAFELLVLKTLDIEDGRRADWAAFHVQKGADFAKKYSGRSMRYEYQAALRLNPLDMRARNAFSKLLRADGFNENYLSQMEFVEQNEILKDGIARLKAQGKSIDPADEKFALVRLSDTIEGYKSLLENTLAAKWDVNPFFLEKTRWKIALYYPQDEGQLLHPELSRVACEHLSILFKSVLGMRVDVQAKQNSNFSSAYADAYRNGFDYFLIFNSNEDERDIKFSAEMYNARTGILVKKFSSFKTGNDRYASALLSLRAQILGVLPVRAKILNRLGKEMLVDIGRTEGMVSGAKFAVIKRGALKTADSGIGVAYDKGDFLGFVTLTSVSEDISEGTLSDAGFYDRVNARDDIILVDYPGAKKNAESDVAKDTSPAANQKGIPVLLDMPEIGKDPIRGAMATSNQNTTLVNMVRRLN